MSELLAKAPIPFWGDKKVQLRHSIEPELRKAETVSFSAVDVLGEKILVRAKRGCRDPIAAYIPERNCWEYCVPCK